MKIGLDWGGTKLEAIALDPITNEELARNRIDSPKDDYQKILNTVCSLITDTAGQEKRNNCRNWHARISSSKNWASSSFKHEST